MKLSSLPFFALSAAAASVVAVGCTAPTDASDEDAVASDDELSVLAGDFVGTFAWRAADSGAFVDIESIELRADGTYAAKVEATLVNPAVRCFRFPCTLQESGKWNAYEVMGKTKIRLRPSTSRARVYGASRSGGELSLTRFGATTTLFQRALLTCANVRCAKGTHCEMKGLNGGDPLPVCIQDPAPCVRSGCSGQLCAEEPMFSTCEWREEYACYQAAACERQADGQCGFTPTPELAACLAGN